MSSTRDAGHAADMAGKIRESKCLKAKDGKHIWKKYGVWPSTWELCQLCDAYIPWK